MGVVVSELLSGRTAVHILTAEINKILLAEATLGLNARCDRFGKRYRNASLVTREVFPTAVVTPIGNGLRVRQRRGLPSPGKQCSRVAPDLSRRWLPHA